MPKAGETAAERRSRPRGPGPEKCVRIGATGPPPLASRYGYWRTAYWEPFPIYLPHLYP